MTESAFAYLETPIGFVEISGTEEAITRLRFTEQRDHIPQPAAPSGPVAEAIRQVEDYFAGRRQVFDLPLVLQGSDFQRQVWQQVLAIPYGEMRSYQDVANGLGNSRAVRAVGAANGQNPIAIIVPCHRVIGANGNLVGYGGGLWRKEWLLKHEGALLL